MKIHRPADRASKVAPAKWFVGPVYQDELVGDPGAPSRLRVNKVSFMPGGRTNWHTHPVAQILYVLSGVGRLQEDGQPVRALLPGDTAVIGAGVKHWHGAAPANTFVHIAMTECDASGGYATWLEPVSDADYARVPAAG